MLINTRRIFVAFLGTFAINMLANTLIAEARTRQLTLTEKTRRSEFVVTGTVSEVQANRAIVNIGQFAKGFLPTTSITVELPSIPNLETNAANFNPRDSVLIFGNNNGPRYMTKIRKDEAVQYEAAVKSIIEYDVAGSTKQKRALLVAMMRSNNPLLQHAALWDFVYLDPNTRNEGDSNDDLLPILDGLARGSDDRIVNLAVQIIGKTMSRKSIPILIDLIESGNARSSKAASRELHSKARAVARNNLGDSSDKPKRNANEWKEWWKNNKDKFK